MDDLSECESLCVTIGLKDNEPADIPAETKAEDEEQQVPQEDSSLPEGPDPAQDFILTEVVDLTANTISNGA